MAADRERRKKETDRHSRYPLRPATEELTDKEKRELLQQLDRTIQEKPIPDTTTDLHRIATKKGYAQPLLINIAAFILVLLSFTVAFSVFRSRQVRLALDTTRYYSTEGKILETYKRQSEQQLKEKDNLIYRILKQVEVLEDQRGELNRLIGLNIEKKRDALDAQIEIDLELEKERLRVAGYEQDEITSRLAEMEETRRRERDMKLAEYRNESLELLRTQEETLLVEIERNQKTLQYVADEREQLVKEVARRELELAGQTGEASHGEGSDVTDVYSELRRIMDAREREGLFVDQINASFSFVADRIGAHDAPAASKALGSLRKLLADPALEELPSVLKRREIDLSIITVLEHYIQEKQQWLTGGAAAEEARKTAVETAAMQENVNGTDQEFANERSREAVELEEQISELRAEIAAVRAALRARDSDAQELADQLAAAEGIIESEAAKSLKMGRDMAFEDVLDLLDAYSDLTARRSANAALPASMLEFDDELLVSINEEIGHLLGGLIEQRELRMTQYKILGTVTLIAQDSIVIEPLVSTPVASGSDVEVRRTMNNGEIVIIARGKVDKESEGRITAKLSDFPADGLYPLVTDKVYIGLPLLSD